MPSKMSLEHKREKAYSWKSYHLTIDYRLQKIAEKAFGEKKGALVAIESKKF